MLDPLLIGYSVALGPWLLYLTYERIFFSLQLFLLVL
jgi:hypothetical protein